MNKSESVAKLAEALSKAQGQIKNALKDSANPFFSSKYADLASVWGACRKELSDNGLAIVQVPAMREGKVCVTTVLLHSSGEWIEGELELTPVKSDPQGAGSAITYARRYALSGFAGVAPDDDDDGNAASGKVQGQQTARVKVGEKPVMATAPTLPRANGKEEAKGIPEAQRKNFKLKFEKALAPGLNLETEYTKYLADHQINFDTMAADDFYGARDDAERYARTL